MTTEPSVRLIRAAVERAHADPPPAGPGASPRGNTRHPVDEFGRRLDLALADAKEVIDRMLLRELGDAHDDERRMPRDRGRRQGLHDAVVIMHRVWDELVDELHMKGEWP